MLSTMFTYLLYNTGPKEPHMQKKRALQKKELLLTIDFINRLTTIRTPNSRLATDRQRLR